MPKSLNPANTVCFTGHRIIPSDDLQGMLAVLCKAVLDAYESGYRVFLCGGALGFDTAAAQTVLSFRDSHPDICLVIAVPCSTQADRWKLKDRESYASILSRADQVIILSENYYSGCMQTRNRFMVDSSSLCLCWMTRFEGGTWSTVRYALHSGVPVKNLAMPDPVSTVMKENAWNYTFIFRSAQKSVSIVHLFPFPRQKFRKRHTSGRFSGKRITV